MGKRCEKQGMNLSLKLEARSSKLEATCSEPEARGVITLDLGSWRNAFLVRGGERV